MTHHSTASTEPSIALPEDHGEQSLAASLEGLKLNALIRSGAALAVLVLAYSMDWMDMFSAGRDFSDIPTRGVSMSASVGGRQSYVLKPGDMEVFGISLATPFVVLFLAFVLRLAYPKKRSLNPLGPLALGAMGTVMLTGLLGYAFKDDTAQFLTSGFYLAYAAFMLNTIFDCLEYADWRALWARAGRKPGAAQAV